MDEHTKAFLKAIGKTDAEEGLTQILEGYAEYVDEELKDLSTFTPERTEDFIYLKTQKRMLRILMEVLRLMEVK